MVRAEGWLAPCCHIYYLIEFSQEYCGLGIIILTVQMREPEQK